MSWGRSTRVGGVTVGPSLSDYQTVDIMINGCVVSLDLDQANRLASILKTCTAFQEEMNSNDVVVNESR